MTSVEIPTSVACALPTLVALDITNEVRREIAASGLADGIAFLTPAPGGVLRVNERETGFFDDVERLLGRLVPLELPERERLLGFVLGAGTEPIPFANGELLLGRWQRILLFGFTEQRIPEWTFTLVG